MTPSSFSFCCFHKLNFKFSLCTKVATGELTSFSQKAAKMRKRKSCLDSRAIAEMLDDSDDDLPKIDIYPEEYDNEDDVQETEFVTRDLAVFVGDVVSFSSFFQFRNLVCYFIVL
jgi:hypothetical protein